MSSHVPEPSSLPVSSNGTSDDTRRGAMVGLSNRFFLICLCVIGGTYVLLILSMLAADTWYMAEKSVRAAAAAEQPVKAFFLENPIARGALGSENSIFDLAESDLLYALGDSVLGCGGSARLPHLATRVSGEEIARCCARYSDRTASTRRRFELVDSVSVSTIPMDRARCCVSIVGCCVLAQFSVACAFAVRTMKSTFDHIDPRCENVAITLGCTRAQAFGWVVLPVASRGMMTALTAGVGLVRWESSVRSSFLPERRA